MKRLVAGLLLLAVICSMALLLTSCSSEPEGKKSNYQEPAPAPKPAPEFFQEKYQKLKDGRTVLCLYREVDINGYSNGASPTMSCDWDGAIIHPAK